MSSDRERSPIDRKRNYQSSVSDSGNKNQLKIFVSNFPFDVKEQDLEELFCDEVGEVAHIQLFSGENGKPRGCGIIELASNDKVKDAIRILDRKDWKGRKLSVKEAADVDRDQYGNIVKPGSHSQQKGKNKTNRVYVSNLPFTLKFKDVKDLFEKEVGEVCFIEMFSDERGNPRGCGILEFANPDMAKKAMKKMNKHELNGRTIGVQEALDQDRDKFGYIVKDAGRSVGRDRDRRERSRDQSDRDRSSRRSRDRSPSNSGHGNFGYTYGLSNDFLESLGIDGPLQTKLFVGNLAFTVDDQKLREVFRLAGRIVNAEVTKNREGRSRGFGIVDYSHPVEAVQAISMFNNQRLNNRALGVRFDRDSVPEERLPKRLPDGLEGVGMGLGAGGKPLTDVLKNLQQNDLSSNKAQPAEIGVKALADLTPTLALLAQQMSMSMAANQGQAIMNQGITSTPMNNQGSFGFNNQNFPQQQNMGYNEGQNPAFNTTKQYNMGPPKNIGTGNMTSANSRSSVASRQNMNSYQSTMESNRRSNTTDNLLYNSVPASYSGTVESAEKFSSNGPSFDTIIVRNLPPEMERQDLQDFFSACGIVKNAMIKEPGVGLVRFADKRSTERALTFDNQCEWERILDVRIF